MSKKKYNLVALFPMKGHSERVKGKNFRSMNGKPLFRWVLGTLLSIKEIDLVVINTDAADLLRQHGLPESDRILLRDRKPEICGDMVSMNKVLEDDVLNIDSNIYMMTHTTNPLISKNTIKEALDEFKKKNEQENVDSLFTVNKIQTRFYRQDGSAVNHDPEVLLRTQDLEPWYEENSNLYIFTRNSFLDNNARIGRKPMMYEMSRTESIDIDDQETWDLAEAVAKNRAE